MKLCTVALLCLLLCSVIAGQAGAQFIPNPDAPVEITGPIFVRRNEEFVCYIKNKLPEAVYLNVHSNWQFSVGAINWVNDTEGVWGPKYVDVLHMRAPGSLGHGHISVAAVAGGIETASWDVEVQEDPSPTLAVTVKVNGERAPDGQYIVSVWGSDLTYGSMIRDVKGGYCQMQGFMKGNPYHVGVQKIGLNETIGTAQSFEPVDDKLYYFEFSLHRDDAGNVTSTNTGTTQTTTPGGGTAAGSASAGDTAASGFWASLFVPQQTSIDALKTSAATFANWGPISLLFEMVQLRYEASNDPNVVALPAMGMNSAGQMVQTSTINFNWSWLTNTLAWQFLRALMGGFVWLLFAGSLVVQMRPKQVV